MATITTFDAKRRNGQTDRAGWSENLNKLPENCDFVVTLSEIPKRSNATRYKYYFDGLLPSIFEAARSVFFITDNDGKPRPIQDTDELHYCLKWQYNSVKVFNKETGDFTYMPMSTTGLSDRDFIGKYMEQIIEYFINQPHCCDVVFYENWVKEWKYKHNKRRLSCNIDSEERQRIIKEIKEYENQKVA